jgi:membrane protein required for beta-lactamase induction
MMKGHHEKAKKILLKAATANKTSLSGNSLEMLERETPDNVKSEATETEGEQVNSVTRTVTLIANISFLWFAIIFVYYGLNINAVYLSYWSKFTSYIVSHHDLF